MEMIRTGFSEFKGDNGAKKCMWKRLQPGPERPVWRKGNFRDVLPSNRCVSRRRCCSAAISSKSTGSAAIVASTDLAVCGGGRDKKSATTFFKPGRYNNCTLNSEIKARWRGCLVETGVEMRERAVTRGHSGRSTVGKDELRRSDRDVCLLPERAIIRGRKLINMILCLLVCGKKKETEGLPMVLRFLLHDSSDISIGGVRGKRKLSVWGGVLEWHHRC